ncbi:hypothetical protein [Nocardia sp. NPDC058633]|uniref:hypothetical protein n=1 Tax=Nocardia sp. NPDC058633 TaxID=3346568 RepID=UPI003660DA15
MTYPAPLPPGAAEPMWASGPPPLSEPPLSESPQAGPPAGGSSRRRLWFVLAVVIVVAVACGVAGYVLTRPEPPMMAVGDCVSAGELPVEHDCGDQRAKYEVRAREAVQWPFELACLKYPDVTRAVAEPKPTASERDTVLCLTPTRNNITDAGGLRPGDCIGVRNGGAEVERSPCGFPSAPVEVIAIELHTKVPVVDRACAAHPQARSAFAQASLAGRAVVICAKPSAFEKSAVAAMVGDCYSDNTLNKVSCGSVGRVHRVLAVRTAYAAPTAPECLNVTNALAVSVSSNDKTDLHFVVCFGPVGRDHLGYGKPGDCVAGLAAESGMPLLVDCGNSTADGAITAVYDEADMPCSPGEASMTRKQAVSEATTICLGPR